MLLRDGKKKVRPLTVVMAMCNSSMYFISSEYRITGPATTYSNACASSAMAIGEGMRWIRNGLADRVIVGGSEAMLTPCTLRAWQAMGVLAKLDPEDAATSCRPFSLDRSGLVIAEGAAAMVLERRDLAESRGAPIYGELAGYAINIDPANLSRPEPESQARAMRAALQDAGVDPGKVGYINAHGTGTDVGDLVENLSIKAVFGARSSPLTVSSTKAVHGHTMGAAGAMEFLVALLAMHNGRIPPTANLRHPDPALELDFVPNVAREAPDLECVLSNSFAFGGVNACLIARKLMS
jgi:3-oxoacyl-[acyl-carrier-protein] synthase II